MTKINIKVMLENSSISISNDKNVIVIVNGNDRTLKASEVFKLFDNGADVEYECSDKAIVPAEGQNLDSEQNMFNDCLEIIQNIITSVNSKILSIAEIQRDEVKESEEII